MSDETKATINGNTGVYDRPRRHPSAAELLQRQKSQLEIEAGWELLVAEGKVKHYHALPGGILLPVVARHYDDALDCVVDTIRRSRPMKVRDHLGNMEMRDVVTYAQTPSQDEAAQAKHARILQDDVGIPRRLALDLDGDGTELVTEKASSK